MVRYWIYRPKAKIDQEALETIHRNKTGALISAAIMMAAVTIFEGPIWPFQNCVNSGKPLVCFPGAGRYSDIISDTEVLGKTAGKDEQVEKSTYPALMGLEKAQAYAQQLHDQAMTALNHFESQADDLMQITQFLLTRKS